MDKHIFYCFSRINRYKRLSDGLSHLQPKMNHVQGENSKTLCGINYGFAWDFDITDDIDNITCQRCRGKVNLKIG